MTKSATWIFNNGSRQQVCPHQLLFEDDFAKLDDANWNLMQRFPGPPVRINRLLMRIIGSY